MLEAAFGIPMWQNAMEDMRIQHEVQSVKHGKWLKRMSTSDSLKCSICGNNHEYITTYCPNCGARMDLKDGDTNG